MDGSHPRPAILNVRASAGLLAAAVLLAACSGAGTSTPAQPTPWATPAATSSAAAASPTSEPSPSALAVLPASADPQSTASAAEQLLPNEIGGQTATKGSMPGDMFLSSGLSTPDLEAVLARLAVRPRDIQVAFAYTSTGPNGIAVFAFRVQGASETELVQALAGGRDPEIRGSGSESKALGGKPTVTIADETMPGGRSVYRYASGSFVFFITAGHESTAAEILSGLP